MTFAHRTGSGVLLQRPRSKYKAEPTEVDGIRFDSKKEALRYGFLRIAEKAQQIADLELQPKYECWVNGTKVCTYKADFRYRTVEEFEFDPPGTRVVNDVKGVRTPTYKLKKKLVEALYPSVRIKET